MNRVTVIIEADHDDEGAHRTEVSAVFDTPDYTLSQVLDVCESALRGAGYAVALDSLTTDRGES
ncbi:MAG: hypothetical protein KAY59_04420 [Acidobacteria bacterium]|nr:hypothetical protein [Acidobacteriota bacterium]